MPSPGAVNSACDGYDNSLATSKLLEDQKNAREKNTNNKVFIETSESNIEQVNSLLKKVDMNDKDQECQSFFDDLEKKIPVGFNIQEPVKSFTGRSEYLKQMHKDVEKSYVCITGMGGVGKTELVRKYIAEHGHEYGNQVVWINAESYRSAVDSFRRLASDKLNISLKASDGQEKKITSIVSDVYQFFSKSKSLFIFDNAEHYKCINESDCGIDQFLPCLPDNCIKPNVIITSRNQMWPESIKIIELQAFDVNETKDLVGKVLTLESDKEEELVLQLGEKLQFLPLALQQAVAYIKMQKDRLACIDWNFDISDYLEKYSEMAQELLDFEFSEVSDSNYNRSVLATLNITLDALKEKENGSDALDVLNIISYFLPDNIPVEFLLIFSSDKQKLCSAIGLLMQYSLVTFQHKDISVHRLVQQVTRIKLQKENKEIEFLLHALNLLNEDEVNLNNLDHVISIGKFASKYSQLLEEYIKVTSFIVDELRDCGRIEEATSIGNEVLSLIENKVSITNLAYYLPIKKTVAMSLLDKGNYKKGLEELQELRELENSFGLDASHNHVVGTKEAIASAFFKLGRLEEALRTYYEILDALKVDREESDPRILVTKSCIAFVLSEEGRCKEALEIMEEICKVQKDTLGEYHDETVVTKNKMAVVLSKSNRSKEALKILQDMYNYQEATLPKYHPKIIYTMYSLADVLSTEEKHNSALKLYRELFDFQKVNLGENHPRVIHLEVRIASVLKDQGEYEKALGMLNIAFKKQEVILGSEHPKTIHTQAEMAEVLFKQQKYVDAIALYKKVLKKHESVLGTYRHSSTLKTRRMMILVLIEQSKFDEALVIALEVLEDSENLFGKDYPQTMADKSNVGALYGYSGDFDRSLTIFGEVLEAQGKILGKSSEEYKRTEYNIAATLEQKNKREKRQNDYNLANVKRALKRGLDINKTHPDGTTMLHCVLSCNDEATVEYLLEQGAEVFVTSNKGNTPLHTAVLKGNAKFVKMLLQKVKPEKLNAFVDARTSSSGSTALHVAAKGGHFGIVKYLLKSHATFCAKNTDGKTPLDLATEPKVTSFLKMVHELFDDVEQADATDVVRKLEALPADELLAVTNTRNDGKLTLLQVAASKKQKEVAHAILQMIKKFKST